MAASANGGQNIGSSNVRVRGNSFTMEGRVALAWAIFRHPNDPVIYREDSLRLGRGTDFFTYTFHVPEAGCNFVNVAAWDSNSGDTPANALSVNH
ncbi:hypothetical protein [Streptomyces albogriseolus]|uniref:hypothetical protein n=1 Tax=Streptomyces albogriseolus TaxID=1887 RepID=UPI0033A9BBE4